ncbi:MAG: hypothetical protein JF590_03215 [Gemmatimonadetes bacterium]|nr:hypothetical protein [Gemmatimonadota bacterium]
MSLARLVIAALAVTAWYLAWSLGARRLRPGSPPPRYLLEAAEAVLLTMFAALWFASLGHGGWWVLFVVVGLLVEGPVRLRHRGDLAAEPQAWRPLLLGTLRLLGAGALLSLLL